MISVINQAHINFLLNEAKIASLQNLLPGTDVLSLVDDLICRNFPCLMLILMYISYLSRKMKVEIENETLLENEVTVSAICDEIISVFVKIHEQAQKWTDATLKQYIALVNSYWHLFKSSYKQIISKQRRLQVRNNCLQLSLL